MNYLLTQMMFYLLGALLLGLLLGWILWGRRSSNAAGIGADVERLRNENYSLRRDLDSCGQARAALEGRLAEALSPASKAPAVSDPPPVEPAVVEPVVTPAAAPPAKGQPAAALIAKPAKAPAKKKTGKEPIVPKPATTAKTAALAKSAKTAKPGPAVKPAQAAKPAKSKQPKPVIQPDDLRRIIGIGPVNERLLHGEGVRTFAQIAKWTAADVKRIEDVLQFDGRIERERWVEQATLLAAGDDKEFAKRFPTAGTNKNT